MHPSRGGTVQSEASEAAAHLMAEQSRDKCPPPLKHPSSQPGSGRGPPLTNVPRLMGRLVACKLAAVR